MSPILQVLQSLAHFSPPYFLALAPILAMRLFGSKWQGGGVWYGVVGGGHGVIETGTMSEDSENSKERQVYLLSCTGCFALGGFFRQIHMA